MNIKFVKAHGQGAPGALWNGSDTLTVTVDDTAQTNVTAIASAINDAGAGGKFTAQATVAGAFRPIYDNGTTVVATKANYTQELLSSGNHSTIEFEARTAKPAAFHVSSLPRCGLRPLHCPQ